LKKFPVLGEKIPCSATLRELGCKPLIYLIDWTKKRPKGPNPEKFPVKFPVLREFEDRGRSLSPQVSPRV
jgi:hypothetical protein